MPKFKLGRIVVTRSVSETMSENEQFTKDIAKALDRYMNADFSDMEYEEDIQMNYDAIKSGEDRIFATYNTCEGKVYIITEWDRSVTTILFPDEY